MQTRLNEQIISATEPSEILGKYTSERLLRTWNEDFVDDDTGEVISIERNEVILEAGTYIDKEALTEINFFLQSGDISSVNVSNQKRACRILEGFASVFSIKGILNDKAFTLFLYARSVEEAIKISSDYMELTYKGGFFYKEVKVLGLTNLVTEYSEPEEPENIDEIPENEEDESHFYKMSVEIQNVDEPPYKDLFVIKATDADYAKEEIIKYVSFKRKEEGIEIPFTIRTLSASVLKCDDVVEISFSNQYINNK